jgi:hypothetical protein
MDRSLLFVILSDFPTIGNEITKIAETREKVDKKTLEKLNKS